MQGCYGSEKDMTNALCAFTPNVPWASGDSSLVKFSGAGTSSATPQIAAAAALYYRKYNKELDALLPWQRVEAIRYALFPSALKKGTPQSGFSYEYCFGNGILQANAALAVPVNSNLPQTPKVKVPSFPILTTLFKAIPTEEQNVRMEMYNTELSQLVYQYPELRKLIEEDNGEEKPYNKISKKKWSAFRDAVIAHPGASTALKTYLMATHAASK